ncbi:hypothetical protein FB645_001595 [Coemansia sp. IMI 203386]|nr:hypothetical protein FB645_001595 [Coemansia sp. IMI 203386]
MVEVSTRGIEPSISMLTLGLVAGLAAAWVYVATRAGDSSARRRGHRQDTGNDGNDLLLDSNRSTLRRTRTIRRHRRQQLSTDTIAEEIHDEAHELASVEANPSLANVAPTIPIRPRRTSRQSDPNYSSENLSSDEEEESSSSDSDNSFSMKLLHLLCTISEQHSRRNGVVHRGTSCNHCQETPIRGVRYKCAQCANVDLCSQCEAHNFHSHHMMLKITVPLPSLMNPRIPLIRKLYPGMLAPRQLPREISKQLEKTTYLDRMDLASLYNEFCVLATVDISGTEVITRESFYSCLGQFGGPRSVLASRLFAFYDEDGDDVLTFEEMARGFSVYNKGTVAEKAPGVFRAYDVDNDGKISRDDLRVMLEAFADTNRVLTRNMVRSMERDVMEDPTKILPGQPVSAAFTAPLPADSPTILDKEVSALRAEVLALRETSAARRVAMLPVRSTEPSDVDRDSDSGASVAATTSATVGTVASLPMPRRSSSAQIVADDSGLNLAGQGTGSGSTVGGIHGSLDDHLQPMETDSLLVARQTQSPPAPTFWHDHSEDDDWSVMEALSQDAIRIMVADIFDEAAPKDPAYLTYDEFSEYLNLNSNLAIYLEVLGAIF